VYFTFQLPTGIDVPPTGTYSFSSATGNPMGISMGGALDTFDSGCHLVQPMGGIPSQIISGSVVVQTSSATSIGGTYDVVVPINGVGTHVTGTFKTEECSFTGVQTCGM
jgi:hypothetical protein